jgi:hypothetical protein
MWWMPIAQERQDGFTLPPNHEGPFQRLLTFAPDIGGASSAVI